MSIKFFPLASGSSGNATYIATDNTKILIDAGINAKNTQAALQKIGVTPNEIDAIFITHEHTDHIAGIGVLSRKFDLQIYATEKTWQEIRKNKALGEISPKHQKIIFPQENCVVNDMIISAFPIPHDTVSPVGYCIFAEDKKITVTTDIGHVTDLIKDSIFDSDILLIESNHDVDMLLSGPYPEFLKNRVIGMKGHLSNVSCGKLLADVWSTRLKHVFLAHLSDENNSPQLALETVANILASQKIKLGDNLALNLALKNGARGMLELQS